MSELVSITVICGGCKEQVEVTDTTFNKGSVCDACSGGDSWTCFCETASIEYRCPKEECKYYGQVSIY